MSAADEAVPDSWRVKNADDIVTRVPSLLGYQHVGCEVNLYPHGKVAISGVSTDDVREGAVLTDLLPKIKGRLRLMRDACHGGQDLGTTCVMILLFENGFSGRVQLKRQIKTGRSNNCSFSFCIA